MAYGDDQHGSTPHATAHAVDAYFNEHLLPRDAVLERALSDALEAGLPDIAVSRVEGKALMLLVKAMRAKRALEVGTLGGFSAIWMGRALPADGVLVSLELEPAHAAVARRSIERAELACRVEVVEGAALDTLPRVLAAADEPFDFAFIDADKENAWAYFDAIVGSMWARSEGGGRGGGGAVVVDNVVRSGDVLNPNSDETSTHGIRELIANVSTDSRVEATAIQTVGAKDHDGFLLAVVG